MSKRKRVLALYGVSQAGANVLMFFHKRKHLKEFCEALPGSYDTMELHGIGYDDFDVYFKVKQLEDELAWCEEELAEARRIEPKEGYQLVATMSGSLEDLDDMQRQRLHEIAYRRHGQVYES